MLSYEQVLERLNALGRPDQLEGMARYGMATDNRLGISIPALRALAKEVGRDHRLALRLWDSGIQEAKILAALVDDPGQVSEEQMESWIRGVHSWDVCDQLCMNLFEKTPYAPKKIVEWAAREEEFVKRAAYALIACLAWHDKKAPDAEFAAFLPVIKRGATDGRNFVKKAVNWALRNIGKRNLALNRAALQAAAEIREMDSRAARWIATDAIRELEGEKVQARVGATKKRQI